jgi:hypothetical protein
MSAFNKIALTAALTALAAPAWADLTYAGSGSYNLGTPSGPGGTVAASSNCGTLQPFSGTDALEFNGSGINNIGLHAYSCNDSGFVNFGSRASGENTYFAQGIASVMGSLNVSDAGGGFSFFINSGEVGAFGSTAFGSGEFQKSKLTIKLTIDNVDYIDQAWSASVSTGGDTTASTQSSTGPYSVGSNSNDGAGYYSYGVLGGSFFIPLDEGLHNISYVMTSEASGNILTTGICTAYLQGGKGQEGVAARVAANAEAPADGPVTDQPFTSYCGAGARSGDPFPDSDPIARAQAVDLPEPMTAGLTLTALLAAAGVRRRNSKR